MKQRIMISQIALITLLNYHNSFNWETFRLGNSDFIRNLRLKMYIAVHSNTDISFLVLSKDDFTFGSIKDLIEFIKGVEGIKPND